MRRIPYDTTIGWFLSIVALLCGAIGFIGGLAGNAYATTWYMAALVLGISSGAILVDELRFRTAQAGQRLDAWLGTLFVIGALVAGVVGFILGLRGSAYAMTWFSGGVILAILALTTLVDELRQLRNGTMEFGAAYAGVFAVIGLAMGIVGFYLGLMNYPSSQTWLWAGAVSSIIAVAAQFEAEHRLLKNERSVPAEHRATGDAGTVTR